MTDANTKLDICLIAPNTHAEVLYTLCTLFDQREYNTEVFASTYNSVILHDVLDTRSWIILEKGLHSFNIRENFKQYDLVIFVTVAGEYKRADKIARQTATVAIVHNGHGELLPHIFKAPFSLYSALHTLKYYITGQWYHKRNFYHHVKGISLPTTEIHNYIINKLDHDPIISKIIDPLPISFAQANLEANIEKNLLVVPGTIDATRKDYGVLLSALSILDHQLSFITGIHFAGALSHDRQSSYIQNIFTSQNFKFIKCHFYKSALNQLAYSSLINNSRALILIPRKKCLNGFVIEKYGFSKMSGGINDMIRFLKPTFLPPFYPYDPTLSPLVRSYNHAEDLAAKIFQLIQEKVVINSAELKKLRDHYSIENQRIQLNRSIRKIIDKYNFPKGDV